MHLLLPVEELSGFIIQQLRSSSRVSGLRPAACVMSRTLLNTALACMLLRTQLGCVGPVHCRSDVQPFSAACSQPNAFRCACNVCNYSLTRARARGFTPTDWERILAGSEQQTRGGCASGGAAPWNSKQQLQKRQAALGRPCKQAATGVQQHCTPVITRHAGCTALLSNAADIP